MIDMLKRHAIQVLRAAGHQQREIAVLTDLAHAIVDRILERGRTLTLDGPSLRTRHLGLEDPTTSEASHQPARTAGEEVIRISGIELPEFPEPTVSVPNELLHQSPHLRDRVLQRRGEW